MIYSSDDFYHKIYTESCDEFEKVRWECLLEKNWLRDNYMPQQLVVEDYAGISVVYDAFDKPVMFAGLYTNNYPSGVAQVAKRMYTFPQFRKASRSGIKYLWKILDNHAITPLYNLHPYDCGFIGMHNREKKSTKGFFKVFAETCVETLSGWHIGNGYINACNGSNDPRCWQNFMYTGDISKWNPKILTEDEWRQL